MIQNKNSLHDLHSAHELSTKAAVIVVAAVVMITGVTHGLHFTPHSEKRGSHDVSAKAGDSNAESRTPREETGPHYTSYGSVMRTPARSGSF